MYCRSTWVAAEFADLCPINRQRLFVRNNGSQIVEKAGQESRALFDCPERAGR